MQSKKGIMVMGLFILAALFYYISGYLLTTSNAMLAGTGISISASYDVPIKFFAFLSGFIFSYTMMLVFKSKEKLIGSAKKILS